jgi:flagellar biosynthesis protein FlhF
MNPKRFWGRDITTALRAVRESLGRDALIIETKTIADGKGGGIEIMALSEKPPVKEPHARATSVPAPSRSAPIEEVRDEIAALRSMLCWLAPKIQRNDVLKCLIGHGVSPEIMARISDAMRESDGTDDREKVYAALKRLIPSGGQIPDAVDRLALIGPTGVGKTSSMIKLTVFENQRLHRRIGWVNTDHRALAGGDPLALYAGILEVRYETAEDSTDLEHAFDRLTDCDLILIDTPGVSPRDERGMKKLQRLLHGIPNLRRALLCSATTNHADMADWVQTYRCLGLNSLFFTKLDECRHFGPLINIAIGAGYPLSYLALGQNMAGDLEIAKPEVLTSLLLTGDEPHE